LSLYPSAADDAPAFPLLAGQAASPPRIHCYMPILTPSHVPQAKTSVAFFHRQNYPARRLVIAAAFDARAAFPGETVVVHYTNDAGDLLAHAQKRQPALDYLCTWLPHSFSHHDRLMLLAACRRGGYILGAGSHVVYHVPRNIAKVVRYDARAIAHASLYPATCSYRPSWGEVPVPRADHPIPVMRFETPGLHYIDVWDRHSLFPESLFIDGAPAGSENLWALPDRETEILKSYLKAAGFPDRPVTSWNPAATPSGTS
jgi:hypothetical protein